MKKFNGISWLGSVAIVAGVAGVFIALASGIVVLLAIFAHMVRAKIQVMVRCILRKYGYPPDLQAKPVQTVLEQAEALSAQWVVDRLECLGSA